MTNYEHLVGVAADPVDGPDLVNEAMIRQWAEVIGDANPVYHDADAARSNGREGLIAPPALLQAWTMRGYTATVEGRVSGLAAVWDELAKAGYTAVVATDSDQEYFREVVPGDRLTMVETIVEISPEKETGLGSGHFVTTERTYRDQRGVMVAIQRWRTLRYRPRQQAPVLRPRPALNQDNEFWFAAAREHRLLIQRCTDCGRLRHPPSPCCPHCRSFSWDAVEASGRGEIHSFVVNHHPQVDGFDYPHTVVLVDLAEGVRLVAEVTDTSADDLRVGLPVELRWLDADPELSLPAFAPVREV